jgi:raffinose/stachyose/melibiose transport system substrate-binding protein
MTKSTSHRILFAGAAIVALMAAPAVQAETITLWTLSFSAKTANAAVAKVAADFEAANPGTKVEIVTRGTDEHKTALRVAAGSDRGPDIYFSWAGLGLGGEYVKAGLSLPLDKYYQQYKWADELLPSAAAFADLYPGGKHGVPFTFKGEGIYFNKALFAKAGITAEPKTYDELVAAADKLKAAGIAPITFGGLVNWHVMRLMDVILETKCGAEKHDALMGMSASWKTEPCATASFVEFDKWAKNYILSPFMGIDNTQALNLFLAGRAAMMLEGDWLVTSLADAKKIDDYDIFPFPTGTNRLYGFSEYHYVSTKSKNPDLAAKFLDYFMSKDVQQTLIGKVSAISVNKDVSYANLQPISAKWLKIFNTFSKIYVNGDQAFPLAVTTEYWRIINAVATGSMPAAEAAANLQTFIDNRK